MSPRIAFLILVLGSAAAFNKSSPNFGSMTSSLMENHLVMVMALSRLPPDEMSIDETRMAKTLPGPPEALNTPRFLVNSFQQRKKEQDKESSKLFSFKTAIIKQANHKALKGGIHIPRLLRNNFQQKWRKTAIQKNTQENINRLNERPVTELPNYWFKNCTKCPKHTWFLKNLEEKEAAAAEAVRTTVIKQVILQAFKEGLSPQPNNQKSQRNLEEKKEAAAEAVRTRIIKQAILQALQESLTLQLNNQQMQRNLSHNVNSRIRML